MTSSLPWTTRGDVGHDRVEALGEGLDSAGRDACISTLRVLRPRLPPTRPPADSGRSAAIAAGGCDTDAVDVVLAVDIGGHQAGRRPGRPTTGGWSPRPGAPTPGTDDAEALFAALLGLVDAVGGNGDVVACGVGCGGPMTAGGETVSPLNIPAWRGFPLRRRLAEATGLATFVDNDAKALALGEGWRGAAAGVRRLHRRWSFPPASAAASCSTAGCSTAPAATPATSATSSSSPTAGRASAAGGAAWRRRRRASAIAAITGRPAGRGRPRGRRAHRPPRRPGRGSVANLLDLRLAVVAGSVALGFGAPFFAAAQAELDARARLDFSRGTRIVPAGLGAESPSWGRPRWHGAHWARMTPARTGDTDGRRDGPNRHQLELALPPHEPVTRMGARTPRIVTSWVGGGSVRRQRRWCGGRGSGAWPCANWCAWPVPGGGGDGRRFLCPTRRTWPFASRRRTATPTGRPRPRTWSPTCNGAAVSVACASLPCPMGVPPRRRAG